jgi:ribosomal protein S18 acetylase RimI-like enzyme
MKRRTDGIIVRQPGDTDFEGILELRWRVLDEPISCSRETELTKNDLRPEAIHVAAFDGNVVISTVRLDPYPKLGEHVYLVRKMATDPKYRRRGIGADVLLEAERISAGRGVTRLVLHSRPDSVAFYKTLGYRLNGRTEMHDGVEDPEMEKTIT